MRLLINIGLLGAFIIGAAACTPTLKLRIEATDGTMRYYDTNDAIESRQELWDCKQTAGGKLTAEYHCNARIWR